MCVCVPLSFNVLVIVFCFVMKATVSAAVCVFSKMDPVVLINMLPFYLPAKTSLSGLIFHVVIHAVGF